MQIKFKNKFLISLDSILRMWENSLSWSQPPAHNCMRLVVVKIVGRLCLSVVAVQLQTDCGNRHLATLAENTFLPLQFLFSKRQCSVSPVNCRASLRVLQTTPASWRRSSLCLHNNEQVSEQTPSSCAILKHRKSKFWFPKITNVSVSFSKYELITSHFSISKAGYMVLFTRCVSGLWN